MRPSGRLRRAAFAALCAAALPGSVAVAADDPPPSVAATELHPTRAQLVGAWRLVSIVTSTGGGTVRDEFFENGSVGLIVYDPSGSMSVQISGPRRVPWGVPEARSPSSRAHDWRLKAAAYDSYYAYFGTWNYDPASATMIHHVTSSVIPAETGCAYAQQISLAGNRMTFTAQASAHGRPVTRIKVWERMASP